MPVLANIASLVRCCAQGPQDEIHPVVEATLVWEDDSILWVGPSVELPSRFSGWERWDAGGRLVIPGLIDCHTHLAFGGWRAREFEKRIRGVSYLEIAHSGGGILSTVRDTRASSRQELVSRILGFLAAMAQLGVTSVECKSGYGLSVQDEIKLLETYREASSQQPLRIVSTLLAAHALPLEFADRRSAYVELICSEIIPRVAIGGLARFCDVFVEESAFTVEEARSIFRVAAEYGLRAKVHADQLSNNCGAELAADAGAISADHLEAVSGTGIERMAEAGTIAVSLPFATLYLEQRPLPARQIIEAGVPLAVATDFNPGSAPSYHLPAALMLACTMQRMTPAEALKGATIIAAAAVGLDAETGSLEVGKKADFAVIDAPTVEHWLYHFRPNACVMTVVGGQVAARSSEFTI